MLEKDRRRIILRAGESLLMFAKFSFVHESVVKTHEARQQFEKLLSRLNERTTLEELREICQEAVKFIGGNRVLLPNITGDQIIEGRLFLIAAPRTDFEKME